MTIWPRAGTTVLSFTPPSVDARRPVQFITISAGLPEECRVAASEMCESVARDIVQF